MKAKPLNDTDPMEPMGCGFSTPIDEEYPSNFEGTPIPHEFVAKAARALADDIDRRLLEAFRSAFPPLGS